MRSFLGKRVRLHRCQPRFVRPVLSVRSQQISRMHLRLAETIEPDALLQLLEMLQLEVCSLGLFFVRMSAICFRIRYWILS